MLLQHFKRILTSLLFFSIAFYACSYTPAVYAFPGGNVSRQLAIAEALNILEKKVSGQEAVGEAQKREGTAEKIVQPIVSMPGSEEKAKQVESEISRWEVINRILDETSGYFAMESQVFIKDPQYYPQKHDSISFVFEPEYYHQFDNGSSVNIKPFMRYDNANRERTHVDMREFNYFTYGNEWELTLGVSKVFWGVTESQHLVDIINQTDYVENIDGEDKLGQPMAHLSLPKEWGVIDMFVLPFFRERTYPGPKGRLRTKYPVDTDLTRYESSQKDRHVDTAFRYSHSLGGLDFGISYFYGTNREPTLLPGFGKDGSPALIPYYEIIDQVGLDLQYVSGGWMWKGEFINRRGQADDQFFASTSGVEYTLSSAVSHGLNIGLLCEWLYDERGEKATSPYDNDLMLGTRVALNDVAGTQALFGVIQDLDSADTALSFEASRRIDNNWKINIESTFIFNATEDDTIYSIKEDDNVKLGLFYYF